jgi:hypothetical protein
MSEHDEPPTEIDIPIEWYIPESLMSRYATNMIVQNSEHEYIISFFDMRPPIIIGVPPKEVLEHLKSIRATCVAQLIVAKDRMPGFVEAMQTHVTKFESKKTVSKSIGEE